MVSIAADVFQDGGRTWSVISVDDLQLLPFCSPADDEMLSRFSTVLQNAVDAEILFVLYAANGSLHSTEETVRQILAPPVPLREDFIYHWKMIMKFFVSKTTDSKAPIESTNIPAHLDQILEILMQEELQQEEGSTGPCMEYFLQHKLLETLHTLARADCPPGMKPYTLTFFTRLLSRIKQPLLPHVNVYGPMQRMLRMCGEVKASPVELDEVQLACIVCAKLKADPYLVNFFLELSGRKDSQSYECTDVKGSESTKTGHFSLMDSLLCLMQSADTRVSMKASEGLLLLVSLPEDAAALESVQHTSLCHDISSELVHLFAALPQNLDPNDLEDVLATWGMGADEGVSGTSDGFAGRRKVVGFLSWLDYCDQLCREAHPIVGDALAASIREGLFQGELEDRLRDSRTDAVVLATACITKCLKHVQAPRLVSELIQWLLGDNRSHEQQGLLVHPVKHLLLDNCLHPHQEVSLESLRLFEVILEKGTEHAFHTLVLANLCGRAYYDGQAAESHVCSWSDEEDEREKNRNNLAVDVSPGSSPVSRTLAPTNIHKIINCFLLVIPEELKSTDPSEGGGYDNYLQDAHCQFRAASSACGPFGWPREAVGPFERDDTSSSDSRPEVDASGLGAGGGAGEPTFYEGAFFKMLFDKLERMLEQPYEINLELTSLVSRLAVLPHPYLHEFLLNPLIPVVPSCRTLFSILEGLASHLQSQLGSVPGFKRKLQLTRKQLLGSADADSRTREDGDILFEGLIVLEEFCKELAAIAFVKFHHSQ